MADLLKSMPYYWVTAQSEYSTDILFKSSAHLSELYPRLLSHRTLCFGAKEVMRWVDMRKRVAYLFRYRDVSMAANSRYLTALADVDDPTDAARCTIPDLSYETRCITKNFSAKNGESTNKEFIRSCAR
jgi:hypothetical protein